MSVNEKIMIKGYNEILDYISKLMAKYNNVNLDLAEIKANCEVNNFFKISEKYDHLKYLQSMPEAFTENNPDYKNEISLDNFIIKIVYQDDKLTEALDGTDSKNIINRSKNFMNYVEEKKNEHQKNKIKKEITSAIGKNTKNRNNSKKINAKRNDITKTDATTGTNTSKDKNKNRKKPVIGRPVRLHFRLDTFNNVKGVIYQFGLRIANKNVKTLSEVKNCIDKFKADLNSYSYKEIHEIITFHPVKVLNPNIPSNSSIDIKLHTNSTTIKNGFWLYYFIIFQDNKDMVISDPFSLMSYKQLQKRKGSSFLERHKALMIEKQKSLYPYYFKSMFSFDEGTNSYKLKETFNFGINFYQKKGIKESNKNSGDNLDMKEDKTISNNNENYCGSDEVMKDLMLFNPTLSDIQLDNILSTNETNDMNLLEQNIIGYNNNQVAINNNINSQNKINNNESNNDEINNNLDENMVDINSNNESDNDEINNNLNENMINLSRNSIQQKNEYPSPSPSQTSSLLSSPIQMPSIPSPPNGSIDDFQNHENLNNYSFDNNDLNTQKDYMISKYFKYFDLLEEKNHSEVILNEIDELYEHHIQCFYNNLSTTKDKFYGNYLISNINYLFQKRFEFSQYFEELDKKIENIFIDIKEAKDNTFNGVHNYNRDDTLIPAVNYNEYLIDKY
ncbi:hypothetical protein LY90DRAFT_629366 [Neocallimastix californiae]|uniref:Uncharacterized protein n=1 Tax=Neocallimastix californiae TaxID=1754190 RepID=A0A1Y2AUL9_9FUNG|nr:hypothetical protein LY90DRAFT_629366 [Neocallimastix californiae]|eukprot:ORY26293.1 hypothetical protein LY90DRAFT_629366 [Neocallimastix californiae]